MILTFGSIINANTNEMNTEINEELVVYDCGDFADDIVHEYGYDNYWGVWFRSYRFCTSGGDEDEE